MIAKLATCTRCNKIIYLAEEVGLRWTADLTPLDAQAALQALVDGKEVYSVTQPGNRLQTAKPDVLKALRERGTTEGPVVVASHSSCPGGAARVLRPSQEGGQGNGPATPPKASAAPSRPLSGPLTTSSTRQTAQDAGRRTSSHPVCDTCGVKISDDEQMVGIQLGELYVYANHAERCPE